MWQSVSDTPGAKEEREVIQHGRASDIHLVVRKKGRLFNMAEKIIYTSSGKEVRGVIQYGGASDIHLVVRRKGRLFNMAECQDTPLG